MEDSTTNLHFFKVEVYDKSNRVAFLFWKDLPYRIRIKYDWYFHYRAALLRITYPRLRHSISWGNYVRETKDLIKAKQVSIKTAITKMNNFKKQMKLYEKSYSSLFPMSGDAIYCEYQRLLRVKESKIKEMKKEVEELINLKDKQ